ncbi:MAG: ATP-binding protein [Chloroflexi bacterium RBG_13_60_13]|nr:MAG: ATP-binding protein [Chloroflexi bacterium RBG_13_60_13]
MASVEKVVLTWSGGKDSALALYELQTNSDYEVCALLTTVTEDFDRVSMHGVRTTLLGRQARSLGFPLERVNISGKSSDEEYESKMKEMLTRYRRMGVSSVAFGDIFLDDVRKYRERNLAKIGMSGLFPLWRKGSKRLANRFIDLGFKAVVTCVDSEVLDASFAGRVFDRQFLADLPSSVDPSGENGEFHSFVYDGPIFRRKIRCEKGEIVLRDNRFYYCDLKPVERQVRTSPEKVRR